MNDHPPVNLLWTGGWDSTFRLLDLLLHWRLSVQPIYCIDPTRKSNAQESIAMETIRRHLREQHPEAADRLAAVQRYPVVPAFPDDRWESARQTALLTQKLGTQYAFIARTLATRKLDLVEMAAEIPSNPHRLINDRFVPAVVNGAPTFVLSDQVPSDSPAHVLFSGCSFPLAKMTKPDEFNIAQERGYIELLKHTWFCHTPRPGNTPCGRCAPCDTVITDGFGWRMPLSARLRNWWHCQVRGDAPWSDRAPKFKIRRQGSKSA